MSTTALPPNLSPAYQPRSFRGASPYPAPPSASSSSLTGGKVGRSLSAHRLEHPLPSRPSTSLPPVPGASARVNAEPISAGAPSSNGNSPLVHRPPPSPAMSAFDERRGRSSGLRNEVKRAEVRQDDSRIKDGKREGREDGAAAQMRKEARSILQVSISYQRCKCVRAGRLLRVPIKLTRQAPSQIARTSARVPPLHLPTSQKHRKEPNARRLLYRVCPYPTSQLVLRLFILVILLANQPGSPTWEQRKQPGQATPYIIAARLYARPSRNFVCRVGIGFGRGAYTKEEQVGWTPRQRW
jgi:hypothetical protein